MIRYEPRSPNPFQRDIDHWNRTGRCLRHYSIDVPPRICEQCGKDWDAVIDGREGRKRRRNREPRSLAGERTRAWSESGTAIEHLCDNGRDGVASNDPANMRAPRLGATPSGRGVRHSGVDE